MLKKFIVIISIIGVILGGVAIVDTFIDEIDVMAGISSIFNKDLEEYVDDNKKSFKSAKVDGWLGFSENQTLGIETYGQLMYENTILSIPLPTTEISQTFSDTIYATDGSFYMVLTKGRDKFKDIKEIKVLTHKMGRGRPIVYEIGFAGADGVLYIQCYTPESATFFRDNTYGGIKMIDSKYDFSKTDDEISSTVSIDKSIIPKPEKMFLEDEYLYIVSEFNTDVEGYSDFYTLGNKEFSYYKAVGFPSTHLSVEYAKLTSLGYIAEEYGSYNGIHYIKFDRLVLLISPVTKNTNLIYHVVNK